jgi:3alpha(or 20beta)-hydroxysteroid dehydrogenase
MTVLVNNDGVSGPPTTTTELGLDDYRRTIEVDQHGVVHGMRTVIPGMIRAGGGSIINLSSTAGMAATSGNPNIAYVTAKFAVRSMSKAAAIEHAANNIGVNSVHPGAVFTPLTEALLDQAGPEFRASFEGSVPLERLARSEEVSQTVAFLASDESSYTTGSEFIIDGGLLAE